MKENNNIKQNIALLVAIISLLLSTFLLFQKLRERKIAYVRSQDLVYDYLGMQEAQREFKQKSEKWKANVDTLQSDYQKELDKYAMEAKNLSKDLLEQRQQLLKVQQKNVMNYTNALNENVKKEDEKITQGVLNQINSFVEKYGKEHRYDVILGTTLSGSLLYGDEALDITKEVLEELNKNYKGMAPPNEEE